MISGFMLLAASSAGCWRPMADLEIIKGGVDFFFLSSFLLSSQKLRERGGAQGGLHGFLRSRRGWSPPRPSVVSAPVGGCGLLALLVAGGCGLRAAGSE